MLKKKQDKTEGNSISRYAGFLEAGFSEVTEFV